jgi:hypothetical protein
MPLKKTIKLNGHKLIFYILSSSYIQEINMAHKLCFDNPISQTIAPIWFLLIAKELKHEIGLVLLYAHVAILDLIDFLGCFMRICYI